MNEDSKGKLEKMTYKEKFIQMNKEAKAIWILGFIVFFVWLVGGFGVYMIAGSDFRIFTLPGWFVIGTLGCWIVAIIGLVYLLKHVFKNFDLGEEGGDGDE